MTAIIIIIGTLLLRVTSNTPYPVSAAGPVVFQGTLSPLVAQSHLIGPADPNQRISLTIGLRPHNAIGLTQYAQDISNPKSVNFHRYLTPTQITDIFGPTPNAYNAVLKFLHDSGFTITHTYNHRLLINFTGTIGQIEQVFHITINMYTSAGGQNYFANTSDPFLPASIAGTVQSISALNNALHLHNALQQIATTSKSKLMQPNSINCPVAVANTFNKPYYTPSQIAHAYSLDQMYSAGYHGEGQTIALYELDTFQMNDLTNYESCFGHSHAPIQVIVAGQNPVPTDQGALEVELDAELVLSTTPQLGMLKIYEAANDLADINAEWARIIQDAPPVVSTSWGACEQNVGLQEVPQENIFFSMAAVQGQTIFAASGDTGSEGCYQDTP